MYNLIDNVNWSILSGSITVFSLKGNVIVIWIFSVIFLPSFVWGNFVSTNLQAISWNCEGLTPSYPINLLSVSFSLRLYAPFIQIMAHCTLLTRGQGSLSCRDFHLFLALCLTLGQEHKDFPELTKTWQASDSFSQEPQPLVDLIGYLDLLILMRLSSADICCFFTPCEEGFEL